MSDFAVPVVRVGKVGKHPNADNLEITTIDGCPCIFRTGDVKPGDLAVYIPVDAVISNSRGWVKSCLSFLKFKNAKYRVKAAKLRGIFSMGILLPVSCVDKALREERVDSTEPGGPDPLADLIEGQLVHDLLGIDKFEEVIPPNMGGRQDRDPGLMPVYDMESWRKYKHVFPADVEVVVTEKIHGTNARFVHDGERLHIGTHRMWRVLDGNSMWNAVANQLDIAEKLRHFPNIGVFGEIYGQVQDLKYGAAPGELRFAVFDMYDCKTKKYLDWDAVLDLAHRIGLPTVPVMYRGPANVAIIEPMATGDTTAGGEHIREGIVIKTTKESWDPEIGRMITKLVSEDYLLRKDGTEFH